MATDAMRVAKAICAATSKRHYSIDRGTDEAWAAAPDYARSEWVADAEAALTAMRSAEPAGWMDIASAPKDGTRLLLFTTHPGDQRIDLAPFTEVQIGYWEDAVDAPMRKEDAGWRAEWVGEPTHWQPLPAPPIAAIEGEPY